MMHLRHLAAGLALVLSCGALATRAEAFCGFYVAKADASLFNKASQVILARDGARTTITMLNDFRGDPREFALVVPVPAVLKRDDVSVVEPSIFDRLDAFSMPRLVEYVDPDPCTPRPGRDGFLVSQRQQLETSAAGNRARALGVRIENSFSVGEYEILVLSATQSDGLETWLVENGYRLPRGAAAALKPYVGQGMKFFVAKVRLDDQASAYRKLRPLQFSFDSPRFMLPMRLGMLNADGPQDLIVYTLTRKGRVESTNYRTVKVPSDVELPVQLGETGNFTSFYQHLFDTAAKREGFKAVFTEFAWDTAWCDPCAGEPLTPEQLRMAGATWIDAAATQFGSIPASGGQAIVTRLHLRYTPQTFPEDLVLQETGDRLPFQARYVMRHALAISPSACPAAADYLKAVERRRTHELRSLIDLTGLGLEELRREARKR